MTYSHCDSPLFAVHETSTEFAVTFEVSKSVGAKHVGGGAQVIKISYPGSLNKKSLSNTKVSAPETSVEVIGSGIVVPAYVPTAGELVSEPLYTVISSQQLSVLKLRNVNVTTSPGLSGKTVTVINSLLL